MAAEEDPARPPTGAVDLARLRLGRSGPAGAVSAPARLAAVAATQLLDTAAEPEFDELAALAARLTGLPLAFITLVDQARSYWKSAIGTGIAAQDTVSRQNAVSESFCQYVVNSDGPIVITDASIDPLTRDNPSVISMGVRAWAGFPVRSPEGHVLGSFCVVDTVPRVFSQNDLDVLEALARSATREVGLRAALASSRRFADQARAQADRLRLLAQASARLGESLQPAAIIEALGALVVPELGSWLVVGFPGPIAQAAFGAEPDGEADGQADRVLAVAAFHQDPARAAALLAQMGDLPQSTTDSHGLGRVIATGRPQYRRRIDVAMEFPLAGARTAGKLLELVPDIGSALTVPLSVGSRVLGAMTIGIAAGDAVQRDLLTDLARRTGTALDHAFDFDRQQRVAAELFNRARRNEQLARAGAALHRKLDPVEELRALAAVVVPDLADTTSMHLLRRPVPPGAVPPLPVFTDRVAAKGIAGVWLPGEATGLSWTAAGDPLPETIRRGGLMLVPIATPTAPDWAVRNGTAETFSTGLHHVLWAPVIVDGLVVAVASFGMCHQRAPWNETDLDTLAEIARYAGIALGHGFSYQRTRDSALILQRSLLTDPPVVDGLEICARYRPAGQDEVGGDWYDVFALSEGDIALVVGDVVGHDITAAAAMGQLRAAMRTVVCDGGADPGRTLDRVAAVNRRLEITAFATMIHARMHRGDRSWTLHWSNAGHPPPILITADRQAHVLQGTGGIPLNLACALPHPDNRTELGPGTTLLLYTDGLVESHGTDMDENIAALQTRLAAAGDANLDLLCDVALAGAPTNDDIALLAVRVNR